MEARKALSKAYLKKVICSACGEFTLTLLGVCLECKEPVPKWKSYKEVKAPDGTTLYYDDSTPESKMDTQENTENWADRSTPDTRVTTSTSTHSTNSNISTPIESITIDSTPSTPDANAIPKLQSL
ncbi:hypothetical protein HNY73_007352 [Argiope bruennichi]|uniref:Uncharacterized protein n=1 Tax=Argiope bruennichi TaxID=94029 RepID=A0A8T0FKP9_ARGBR|nr:hypothetical protein HNY73_007352 [Argiope bruennichi]